MELWSLLRFLMPHIFESHKEFKDWFSNPVGWISVDTHVHLYLCTWNISNDRMELWSLLHCLLPHLRTGSQIW